MSGTTHSPALHLLWADRTGRRGGQPRGKTTCATAVAAGELRIDLHGPLTTFSSHSLKHVFAFSEVRVEGLETLDYLDNLQSKNRCTEQGDAVVFESEVDKVYLSAPPKIVIIDHEKKRTFVLRKEGLPDVVVWNPWDKKAKAMPDFGDEEYKSMPGEEWIGKQEISAVPSSYSSGQLDPELICRMHTI
ncbi:putative glucose-6-phosphate 1-epimerase [Miscanthus floridulus]|uniref:putative glucose-6-phosphate 1-epimerase n=1 Tax=Miscanthus floridulus TaxID=154761 RepID=UPI00345965E3